MNGFDFPTGRALDLVCLGRAGVDLYAEQEGMALEDVTSFRKSVGGSPANMATAFARLGGRAGIISAVSDDGFGRYVRRFLSENRVDVRGLRTAPAGALNSVAFTEIRPDNCQVIIFRRGAADLQLTPADVDARYVADSRALLVTGTALSAQPSRDAAYFAMQQARAAGTAVVLDLDYRPYGWSDTAEAAQQLKLACAMADIVVGNREEFDVLEHGPAARPRDDFASARHLLRGPTRVVVVKDGQRGCQVFDRDGAQLHQGTYSVTARKPFGSGDAFAATTLWALMREQSWLEATRLGAAAAAVNVSRNACAEAMASHAELMAFVAQHPAPAAQTSVSTPLHTA
jgi:5-dehydro-2-deoxygluconokinase